MALLESANFSTKYTGNYVCKLGNKIISRSIFFAFFFNFRDHVTTFRHPSGAYISQMPGHRLSRIAKGTPSESRLFIGSTGLG